MALTPSVYSANAESTLSMAGNNIRPDPDALPPKDIAYKHRVPELLARMQALLRRAIQQEGGGT